MSKRPSLTKQIVDTLNSYARFGESKYEAKQVAYALNKSLGVTGWNPARLSGIYSIETMKTYRTASIDFGEWCKKTHGSRWLEEMRPHAGAYLQMMRDSGRYSADSLKTNRAALRKLFQDPYLAKEVVLPDRKKENITRSRGAKAMDRKFSELKNRNLVDFARACGLRRHELRELRAGDVRRDGDRLYVYVRQGKGGRDRAVPVLAAHEQRVMEIIRGKDAEEFLFPKITKNADIHGYRREYTSALYQQLTGRTYDPAHKDKIALQRISWALGHNRLSVVTRNYLD